MIKEKIDSVKPITTRAGKPMWVINGEYFASSEPSDKDLFVIVREVTLGEGDDAKTISDVSFGRERFTREENKKFITGVDAAYSSAMAMLAMK